MLVLLIATARWSAIETGAFVPYLAAAVAAAAITASAVLVQVEGLPWNYFPAKIAWTWLLAGLPLLLVPFAHPRIAPGRRAPAVAGSVGVVLGALALSPLASPVLPNQVAWMQSGLTPSRTIADWDQPDVASLRLAVELGHPRTRYVVYGVFPEDDRLTNFWLAAYDPYDGPTDEDEFITWGNHETGTAADVCALLDLQPDRVVATTDPGAEQQLRQECGRDVRVRLLTPGG